MCALIVYQNLSNLIAFLAAHNDLFVSDITLIYYFLRVFLFEVGGLGFVRLVFPNVGPASIILKYFCWLNLSRNAIANDWEHLFQIFVMCSEFMWEQLLPTPSLKIPPNLIFWVLPGPKTLIPE